MGTLFISNPINAIGPVGRPAPARRPGEHPNAEPDGHPRPFPEFPRPTPGRPKHPGRHTTPAD